MQYKNTKEPHNILLRMLPTILPASQAVAVWSDIHIDVNATTFLPRAMIPPCSTLVIAGDLGGVDILYKIIHWLVSITKKGIYRNVVLVLGNHDMYQSNGIALARLLWGSFRAELAREHVYLLDNETLELEGVHFIGSTFWTDPTTTRYINVPQQVKNSMKDYRGGIHGFTLQACAELHAEARDFVAEELKKHENDKTIVVTHHLPSFKCIAPKYQLSQTNGAFASESDDLMTLYTPTTWIHGHTHSAVNIVIGNTHVVCHPRGYPSDHTSSDQQEPAMLYIR